MHPSSPLVFSTNIRINSALSFFLPTYSLIAPTPVYVILMCVYRLPLLDLGGRQHIYFPLFMAFFSDAHRARMINPQIKRTPGISRRNQPPTIEPHASGRTMLGNAGAGEIYVADGVGKAIGRTGMHARQMKQAPENSRTS